jgi:carboxyl-terminal processing protease
LSSAESERRRGFVRGVATGAAGALVVALLIVWLVGPATSEQSLVDQARDTIEKNYYKPVAGKHLDNASIEGMVRRLHHTYDDKFSHYFDPAQLASFDRSENGNFSGVGLTVSQVPKGLRIASVLPGTPAKRANLAPGDVITAVDGRSIAGVASEVSTARIKGPPGTKVTLRVASPGDGPVRSVTLRRATVHVPAVSGHLITDAGEKVAYVRFAAFNAGAHGELRDTLQKLYSRGGRGVILDLRGNPGGLLNEAVLSASVFLPKGKTVVTTDSRTQGHREYDAAGDPLTAHPMVVLINRDTASSAEILTKALADNGAAEVVGTRSYGKGVFQEILNLPAGGALDLTVGQWFGPNGESVLGKGVTPDVHARDLGSTPADEALQRARGVLAAQLRSSR